MKGWGDKLLAYNTKQKHKYLLISGLCQTHKINFSHQDLNTNFLYSVYHTAGFDICQISLL